jgi:hypothetical protein
LHACFIASRKAAASEAQVSAVSAWPAQEDCSCFSQSEAIMTRYHFLPVVFLLLLLACEAPGHDPFAPAVPHFGVAVEHAIHLEEQGRTTELYLASDPTQLPVVLTHCGPTAWRYVVQVAYGTGTHLGHTMAVNEMCVYPPGTVWTSHAVITAANGDQISGNMSGSSVIINPEGDYLWFAEPIHFTAGTGRFANAVLDADWHGGGNIFDGTVYGVLDGTLRYAASDVSKR